MSVITDDDLHASLRATMRFAGSLAHQPKFNPASVQAEGGSSSGVPPCPLMPRAGAAAASSNGEG